MKQKPFLLQHLFHRPAELLHVIRGPARHIRRARRLGQRHQVERRFENAVGIGRADHFPGRGGRGLAARHGVGQVVDADHLDIHVAPRGVDEVIAADGEQVAIARVHHHGSSGFESFSPVANGMARPCVVWNESSARIPGHAAGASDPRHDRHLIQIQLRVLSSARVKQLTVVPIPQAGHQMCGMRSMRRNGSTGLRASAGIS